MFKSAIPLALAAILASSAAAQEQPEMLVKLRAMHPKTTFKEVRSTEIAGIYEVVMGENTAYTDESGRYFIFGHLVDMRTLVDVTAQRQAQSKKVEFPSQFLANAIKTVKGDGSRVFAVFSDPDCPYCKQLEGELARLDNVTIYTFLYPIESQHPEAKTKSVSVWCAPDRQKAWTELMLSGKKPRLVACNSPVNDNLVIGSRLGVLGTPTLIAADGRILPGSASAAFLDKWLNATQPASKHAGDSK